MDYKGQGFTLFELIVVMAILAIIAAMATPSFMNMVASHRLDQTTRELALLLTDARSSATTLRKDVTIKFAAGAATPTLYYWQIKHENIELQSDSMDVVFSPIGVAKQRDKMVTNEDHDPNDPNSPAQIKQIVPLEFVLCHTRLGKSKTIFVSRTGTVDRITTGAC